MNYIQQYSSKYVQHSCVLSSYAAHHGRVVKAPWVQKTKLQNTSTTVSHEPIREVMDTPTYRPTHLPVHLLTMHYSSTAVCVAASSTSVLYLPSVYPAVSCWDIHFLRFSSTPGSERPFPGSALTGLLRGSLEHLRLSHHGTCNVGVSPYPARARWAAGLLRRGRSSVSC